MHFRVLVNYDLINTVPLSEVFVSLFKSTTLNIYPVVKPNAFILEEINPLEVDNIISGPPSRINIAKINP